MSFIKKHSLIIIFLAGFIIRLLFIFGNYSFDVNNHIIWAKDLHEKGFSDFFNRKSSEVYAVPYPNYPPLSLFIFYLFYPLPKFIFDFFWWLNVVLPFFPSSFITLLESIDKRLFLAAMLKLPAILADIGLAWMLVIFTKKIIHNKKNLKLLAASLILFNPAFIYNSSFWGQIDVIPLLFVFISIYLLLFTKKDIFSGVFFTLSLLIKPTTLIFLPVYGLFFLKRFGWFHSFKTILISNLFFLVLFLPFMKNINILSPYLIYWQKIISAQSLPYVTNGAFNFWLILIDLKKEILDVVPFLFNITYRVWGYLLIGFFLVFILYRFYKSRFKTEIFFFSLFLSSFVSIIFLTKMHERYFILPLPFLLMLIVYKRNYLKYFYLLSFLAFLNQYHSWAYPYIWFVFNTIDSSIVYRSLSALNVFIFLYFFKKQRP